MALVTLLAHTPQPELHVAAAAKLCYSPSSIDKIKEGLTEEKVEMCIRDRVYTIKGVQLRALTTAYGEVF